MGCVSVAGNVPAGSGAGSGVTDDSSETGITAKAMGDNAACEAPSKIEEESSSGITGRDASDTAVVPLEVDSEQSEFRLLFCPLLLLMDCVDASSDTRLPSVLCSSLEKDFRRFKEPDILWVLPVLSTRVGALGDGVRDGLGGEPADDRRRDLNLRGVNNLY
ncbi:hypothetical protein BV22DRAFT_54384 [Leucogyrophana mollusca]|uniref:Uncharacterized protein n=1 Tax=Leucogyrophana mollusca TaxID=85980 RepID=A0ACB8C0H9_9AGAM|nr:hypothetical protein BV22DRAFT_54384 [Leucogyrophana mollusca]